MTSTSLTDARPTSSRRRVLAPWIAAATFVTSTLVAGSVAVVSAAPAGAAPAATAGAVRSAAAPTAAVPAGYDITMTREARASRAHRATISLTLWVRSPHARMIVQRESGGSCSVVNWAGPYYGKWQMTGALWLHGGGGRFAPTPHRATCAQQDVVAYRIWVMYGWSHWGG